MNKNPENFDVPKTAEQPEGGVEGQKDVPDQSAEHSPEAEIQDVLGEMNVVSKDIFAARRAAAESKRRMGELREGMGVGPAADEAPSVELQNQKIAKFEERKNQLREKKEAWVLEHGEENLPEGVAIESGEDESGARAGFPEEQELSEEEKKENLEHRKKWLREWQEKTVQDFERAMRGDWRTKDAVNLDLTIELMKKRVPKAMEKEAAAFLSGKEDEPFGVVWLHWGMSSLLDRITGRPNQIKKLEVTFDDKAEKIAGAEDLQKQKEGEEDKQRPAEQKVA